MTLVGAAPTDIGDRVINIGIGRFRPILEQRHDGHDHSALAVSALRDIKKDKSGNPGGRPRQLASVMHEARRYTFEAIRTLLKLMRTAESE
jgi:hypothetical protein